MHGWMQGWMEEGRMMEGWNIQGHMNGETDGWMDGPMDAWRLDRRMDSWVHGWMMDGCMLICMDTWVDKWMDDGKVKAGGLAWTQGWRLGQKDKDKETSQTSSSLWWRFLSCCSRSDGGPCSSSRSCLSRRLSSTRGNSALCRGRIPLWGWTDFNRPSHPATQLEAGPSLCPPAVAEE